MEALVSGAIDHDDCFSLVAACLEAAGESTDRAEQLDHELTMLVLNSPTDNPRLIAQQERFWHSPEGSDVGKQLIALGKRADESRK